MRRLINPLPLSTNGKKALPFLVGVAFALFVMWQSNRMVRLRSENAVYRQLFDAQAQGTLDIAQTQRVLDAFKKERYPFGPGTLVIVNGKQH